MPLGFVLSPQLPSASDQKLPTIVQFADELLPAFTLGHREFARWADHSDLAGISSHRFHLAAYTAVSFNRRCPSNPRQIERRKIAAPRTAFPSKPAPFQSPLQVQLWRAPPRTHDTHSSFLHMPKSPLEARSARLAAFKLLVCARNLTIERCASSVQLFAVCASKFRSVWRPGSL